MSRAAAVMLALSSADRQAEEAAWVAAARAGETGGILRLLERYRPPLVRLLTGVTGDPGAAEDLAQEVYLKLAGRDPAIVIENPKAMLYRMAINVMLDKARSDSRAAARGAVIRTGARCTRAERGKEWRLVAKDRGFRKVITARAVVNAAGAWVDEEAGKVFCLVDAPDRGTAARVHREAHGLEAHTLHLVEQGA